MSGPITVFASKTEAGAWKADVEGQRGTGTEALAREKDVAILMAVRQLALCEGFAPGVCLGCEGPLDPGLCRIGAFAHPVCVDIEIEGGDA